MNTIDSIWDEYYYKLHWFIQNRISDPMAGEDILQEVFIKIHTRIQTVKDQKMIKSWVYSIAKNKIIDYYRSKKRTEPLTESINAIDTSPIEETQNDIVSCLIPMIKNLPDKYSQTLLLSEINRKTKKEVALKLEISLPGVKARVKRGRVLIKKMLNKCCNFEFDLAGRMVDYKRKEWGKCCVCAR